MVFSTEPHLIHLKMDTEVSARLTWQESQEDPVG
jgi:hypothetical protein